MAAPPSVLAWVGNGLAQAGSAVSVSAEMANGGTISLVADAFASGTRARAHAKATTAMFQGAWAGPALLEISNTGSVNVSAKAAAIGTVGNGSAVATDFGVGQFASAASAFETLTNSGTIAVVASALASGNANTPATLTALTFETIAGAAATGAWQTIYSGAPSESFSNNGVIDVRATAVVEQQEIVAVPYGVDIWRAGAGAIGYDGYEASGQIMDADVSNSGTIRVGATAISPGTGIAGAVAQGIVSKMQAVRLHRRPQAGGTNIIAYANPIFGTLTNSGTIDVAAMAAGGLTVHTTSGGHIFFALANEPRAIATGISISGGINTMTVTNTGTIAVDAVVTDGPFTEPYGTEGAKAYGLRVIANGVVEPDPKRRLHLHQRRRDDHRPPILRRREAWTSHGRAAWRSTYRPRRTPA